VRERLAAPDANTIARGEQRRRFEAQVEARTHGEEEVHPLDGDCLMALD